MSEETAKASAERILYRVQKINGELSELSMEEHGTVVQMLVQLGNYRMVENQRAISAQRDAATKQMEEKLAEQERQAKFGLN